MIKELLKPTILGLSFIIGILIYTEQTKYEFIDDDKTNGILNYYLLNKKNGEVIRITSYGGNMNEVQEHRIISPNGKIIINKLEVIDNTKEE